MKRSGVRALLCVSLVASFGNFASASSPALSNIIPRGAQRGTEVEVTLNGARLEDAQELLIYQPGIEVAELTVVNGNQVKAKLKIAADCAPGTKRLRVRCASGISDLRTFVVGPLPVVAEVEPNSEFTTPQPIPMNVTIDGTIGNEDVDYFVVEAKQGERITAEVEAIRLGDSFFDVYVAILNEARFELATSDDAALVWQDGVVSILAPADGKYFIQVRESSFGGGNYYRCHVGNFPRPLGVVPGGGKPGETLKVKFIGDVGGEIEREITLPADADPDFSVFATDDRGISPSGNRFRLTNLDNVNEVEPNEDIARATKGPAPAAFNGVLSSKDDVDYFGFTAKQGQVFDISVWARRLRSELDPVLVVYNPQGGGLASNDDAYGPDSGLRFTAPADGEYFLRVYDHLGRGGNSFFYRIEVSHVTPELTLGIAEFVQYVEPKIAVPQGNRIPLLLTASRANFGGPLEFLADNLPPGITIEHAGMRADENVTQVLLVAAPDAQISGKIGNILGKLADPAQPNVSISGPTRQDVVLIRGQNNQPFWTEPVKGLAVAVAQKAPFTLQVIEPKVPLVQGGQAKLKVVATRDEGFTAPIKIELLQNPPGMNSSREAAIPEGQTEAFIDINAAGNARVGDYKIAVRGEATVGNGPVMIASPFVNFRMAEMYVKFTFQQAAIEQGKEGELVVNIETAKPFEGNAPVVLYGLPNKVTTAPLEVNQETKELVFKIKAEPDAPAGKNQNLFCQVVITENGEPVLHNLGTGQLRVDQPLPPKPNAPAAPAAQAAAPMPEAPKRLTRLEQLRLEQKQRLEAANAKPAEGGK
jgi:hypothetical protein